MAKETESFYLCTVKVPKVNDKGETVAVTEKYLVEAVNFTDAEASIIKELSAFYDLVDVVSIVPRKYSELSFSQDDNDDKWYKVKVGFITIDEKTAKEKVYKTNILVNASTLHCAIKAFDELMKGSMADYTTLSVAETDIVDVFVMKERK